jgi:hypothetical protein
MGRFTPIAGAETALTREFGKHVFEIAEVLRVAHILYNYRVWVVVCAVICEPVSTVNSCVYRQLKHGRSDDEVRPGWCVNSSHRLAEPGGKSAHPCAKTDAF